MEVGYNFEEYKKKQNQDKEELSKKIHSIVKSFKDNPKDIVDFLKFSSQFYNYSSRNTMLIFSQNKGATFTGSYNFFKEKGFPVKKGEKGLKILVPTNVTYINVDGKEIKLSNATKEQKELFKQGKIKVSRVELHYKIGNVFDIAQTNCPIEKYPQIYNMGNVDKTANELVSNISNFLQKHFDCPVVTEDLKSISLRGFYTPSENTITLNDKLQDTEKLSTLIHELGHAILHRDEKNLKKPTCQIELEADSLSVMLQQKLSLEFTDSIAKHLQHHYLKFEKHINTKHPNKTDEALKQIETVINNVFNEYKKIIEPFSKELNLSDKDKPHSILKVSEKDLKAIKESGVDVEVRKDIKTNNELLIKFKDEDKIKIENIINSAQQTAKMSL